MRYSNLLRYVFGYGVPLVFSSTALLATKMMEDEDNSSESDNNDFEEHQVEGEPQYCCLSVCLFVCLSVCHDFEKSL